MDRELIESTRTQVGVTTQGQWRNSIDDQRGGMAGKRGPIAVSARTNEITKNGLLAGLSSIERDRVALLSDIVPLTAGQMLNDSDREGRYVYFPMSGSIALTVVLADGVSPEVASVGRDGIIGSDELGSSEKQMSRAIVKSAGIACRMKAGLWQREFSHSECVQQALFIYKQTLMTEVIQIAACNRHHSLQQRLARWLLTTFDHAYPLQELPLTQEFIATLLSVRREGITSAAGKLQLDGAIRYKRGNVTMVDRAALERCACECYQVIKPRERNDQPLHASRPATVIPAMQAHRGRSVHAI